MIGMTWSRPVVYRELRTEALLTAVDVSEDGSLLILLFSSMNIEIWDLTGEKAYRTRSFQSGSRAKTIALSPDHTALAIMHENDIEILSLSQYTRIMARKSIACSGFESISFSPDGFMLLCTTTQAGKTSLTAIHAMNAEQRSDMKNTHVRLDKVWTSHQLFLNTVENTSHAVVLPGSMDGSDCGAYAHDASSGSFCVIDLCSVRTTRVVANDTKTSLTQPPYMALPSLDTSGELAAIVRDESRIRVMATHGETSDKHMECHVAEKEHEEMIPKYVERVFWVSNASNSLKQRLVVVSSSTHPGKSEMNLARPPGATSTLGPSDLTSPNDACITVLDYDIRVSDNHSSEQELLLKAPAVDDLVEHTWSLEAELALARRVGSNSSEGMLARFVNLTLGRTGSHGLRGVQQVANRGIRNVGDLQKIKKAAESIGIAPSSLLAAADVLAKDPETHNQALPTAARSHLLSDQFVSSEIIQQESPPYTAAATTQSEVPTPLESLPGVAKRARTSPERTSSAANLNSQAQDTETDALFKHQRRVVRRVLSDPFAANDNNTTHEDSAMSEERPKSASFAGAHLTERTSASRLKALSSILPGRPTTDRSVSSSTSSSPPSDTSSLQQMMDRQKRHSAPPGWIDEAVKTTSNPAQPVPRIPAAYSPQRHALRHTSLPSVEQLASLYRRLDADADVPEKLRSNSAPRAALGAGRRVNGVEDLQKSPSKSPSRTPALLPSQNLHSPERGALRGVRGSYGHGRPPAFRPLKTINSVESGLSSHYNQDYQHAPTPSNISSAGPASLPEEQVQTPSTPSSPGTPQGRKSWTSRRASSEAGRSPQKSRKGKLGQGCIGL